MFQIIWPTVSFSQRVRLSVSIIIIQLLCTQLQEKSLASFATVKNEIKKNISDRVGKLDIDTRQLGFFFSLAIGTAPNTADRQQFTINQTLSRIFSRAWLQLECFNLLPKLRQKFVASIFSILSFTSYNYPYVVISWKTHILVIAFKEVRSSLLFLSNEVSFKSAL